MLTNRLQWRGSTSEPEAGHERGEEEEGGAAGERGGGGGEREEEEGGREWEVCEGEGGE